MNKLNLPDLAASLPSAWRSHLLAQTGQANIKLLRMDSRAYDEEVHNYPEALLVLEGQLELVVNGDACTVRTGEMFVVSAGVPHAVRSGSNGMLLIMDALPVKEIKTTC